MRLRLTIDANVVLLVTTSFGGEIKLTEKPNALITIPRNGR